MDTELMFVENEPERSPEPQIIEPEIISHEGGPLPRQKTRAQRKPTVKKPFIFKALGLVGTILGGILAITFAGVFLAVFCVIIVIGLLFLLLRLLFGGSSKVIVRRF